jgi:hypothetical protein
MSTKIIAVDELATRAAELLGLARTKSPLEFSYLVTRRWAYEKTAFFVTTFNGPEKTRSRTSDRAARFRPRR